MDIGETVKRIDGTEVPLVAPWGDAGGRPANTPKAPEPTPAAGVPADETGVTVQEAPARPTAKPAADATEGTGIKPSTPLPGQAELAGRKGSWKYEGGSAAEAAPAAEAPAAAPTDADKPATLEAARDGKPDDLKQIKGVGPKLETLLHDMGFFHFDQIASWTAGEIAWVDENLTGFKGRVSRDNWVDQAKKLAAGEETEFSSRVKKGDVY